MILILGFVAFPIPTIGLSVDVGVLYSIRARLSMADDAGALAGGRALACSSDSTAQQTSAQNTVTSFVKMNFPTGYFSSYNLTIPTPTLSRQTPPSKPAAPATTKPRAQ